MTDNSSATVLRPKNLSTTSGISSLKLFPCLDDMLVSKEMRWTLSKQPGKYLLFNKTNLQEPAFPKQISCYLWKSHDNFSLFHL